jgi:hypothetical protein
MDCHGKISLNPTQELVAMKELTLLRNAARTKNRDIQLRTGNPDDAQACGEICYQAFETISVQHSFSSDFPDVEAACDFMRPLLDRPDLYSVVAEVGGQVVGSNFLWSEQRVAGIGPLSVSPSIQNATVDDLAACNLLCKQIHGFVGEASQNENRERELSQAIDRGTATVVEQDNVITGYATSIGFCGHAVGTSNRDLQALIGAATSFAGQGFLVPTRNTQLFRWCLQQGLQIVQPMTLMSRGLYVRPAGAFLPSILF